MSALEPVVGALGASVQGVSSITTRRGNEVHCVVPASALGALADTAFDVGHIPG